MTKLLRVDEAATALGISRARLYELARRGIVPAVYLGRQVRFEPGKLQEWLANGGQRLDGGWRRAS